MFVSETRVLSLAADTGVVFNGLTKSNKYDESILERDNWVKTERRCLLA